MQFLSGLSLLGLLAFIAFSSIGRADVMPNEEVVERHVEYGDDVDPKVIIDNKYGDNIYIGEINVTVEGDLNGDVADVNGDGFRRRDGNDGFRERRGDRRWREGRRWRRSAPEMLPYPRNTRAPACRIYQLRNGYMYDLWIGNVVYRRGEYYWISSLYWQLVHSGQCRPMNGY